MSMIVESDKNLRVTVGIRAKIQGKKVGLVGHRRHKWLLGLIYMYICVFSIWLIADASSRVAGST